METRTANLIIGTSGGTAGGNATNYKLALPSTWIKEMGLTPEQRQVELRFDGTSIVITRKLSFVEFLEASRHTEHKTLLLSCYSGDTLCARIAADETEKTVRIENLATDYLKLPFGKNPTPSWTDYRHFLEAIGVDRYEPLEIIRKTQGRMAGDDLWLTVEELK